MLEETEVPYRVTHYGPAWDVDIDYTIDLLEREVKYLRRAKRFGAKFVEHYGATALEFPNEVSFHEFNVSWED